MSPVARFAYQLGRQGYRLDSKWQSGDGRWHWYYIPREHLARPRLCPGDLVLELVTPAR